MRNRLRGAFGTAMRWMLVGEWRAHPGRALVAAVAIAVGVALGFAVHLINASALNEFGRAVRTVNGDADLQIHSVTPLGFREELYPKLARLPEIADASPVIELPASAESGPDPSLTLLGIDVLRAIGVTPILIGHLVRTGDEAADPRAPAGSVTFAADAVFLSQAALAASGKHLGDKIEISAAGQMVAFSIVGTLPGVAEDQKLAVTDIAAAQWRFGKLGVLQRIDLKLAHGVDEQRARRAIAKLLPANAEIATPQTETQRTDSLSRAYRVNLDMLALMALLTGAFLAYSAQALSVARRHAQFALLRVLGIERRALFAQVLIEGAGVGFVGGIFGLGLGLGLAALALRYLGGDLGGGYFTGTRPELIFAPGAALLFLLLGVSSALVGSILPAREAAQAQPAVALKQVGDTADPRVAPRPTMPLLLLIGGTASAFFPAVNGLPVFGYLSIALLLAGGIAAMPLLARILLAPLQRFSFAVPADLAAKHLWGAPSQAAIALCGIVASTSLMIAMAVMVSSFRHSVDEWLVQVLPADLYLRLEGEDNEALSQAVQRRLAAVPGVAAIHFRKLTPLRLSPEKPPITWLAETIDPTQPAKSLPLIGASLPVPAGAIPVWLSEPAVWLYGYRAGDWIGLPVERNGAERKFFIAGIWRDYGRQQGTIAMGEGDYTRLTGDTIRSDAAINLVAGASEEATVEKLRAALPQPVAQRAIFADSRELRAMSLQIFDRSFAVTYLLEAIAILVGLAGVAATFSAQVLARTKEFGMLRHIGVLRRQIVTMLAAEGALLGAVGVVAGIGLGIAISQVLIQVINPQSFHWTMETRLPPMLLGGVTVALIVAAAGTALIAGRRALSADAVLAVREDW